MCVGATKIQHFFIHKNQPLQDEIIQRCYHNKHAYLAFIVGIPGLVFYVVGYVLGDLDS